MATNFIELQKGKRVNKLKLSFCWCVKGYGVMRGYRISFVYVVFLTHEESISRSAQRVLSILDGEIASDERSSGDSAEAN